MSTVEPSLHRTRDQERAAFAFRAVFPLTGKSVDQMRKRNYLTQVEKLGAMIITNGLGQTMAFLLSRKDAGASQLLYGHLQEWLTRDQAPVSWASGARAAKNEKSRLIDWIVASDSVALSQATKEALALVAWLKLLAKAYLEGDNDTGPGSTAGT